MPDLITEDWLKSVGFKWHQLERQPNKQWLLWLGSCLDCGTGSRYGGAEDIGVELAWNGPRTELGDEWFFCWFRSDLAGRYSRFIHIRHLRTQDEVTALVSALSDRPWNPENHIYGSVLCDGCANRSREEQKRLDRYRLPDHPWRDVEKDDSRGGALPEHMQAAIDGGKAK